MHSIPWIMLQKLIWNKCLCFDLLLPHLSAAENLQELRLDYSTLEVNYRTVPNLMDLITNNHEFTIFHNLHNCSQLKIFSCAHCKIYWSPDDNVTVPIYLTNIGQFCTRWLLQSAPLSLREYTGPLNSKDQSAVIERYGGTTNFGSGSAIVLNPKPLDNVQWFNDEDEVMVAE